MNIMMSENHKIDSFINNINGAINQLIEYNMMVLTNGTTVKSNNDNTIMTIKKTINNPFRVICVWSDAKGNYQKEFYIEQIRIS